MRHPRDSSDAESELRQRLLYEWGTVEAWSPAQVCTYITTNKCVAEYMEQHGLTWERGGRELATARDSGATAEERFTRLRDVVKATAAGWNIGAVGTILSLLMLAFEYRACMRGCVCACVSMCTAHVCACRSTSHALLTSFRRRSA